MEFNIIAYLYSRKLHKIEYYIFFSIFFRCFYKFKYKIYSITQIFLFLYGFCKHKRSICGMLQINNTFYFSSIEVFCSFIWKNVLVITSVVTSQETENIEILKIIQLPFAHSSKYSRPQKPLEQIWMPSLLKFLRQTLSVFSV